MGVRVLLVACLVLVALLLVDMPYNTGLLLAGLAAMIVGAQVELMMERRK